MPHRTTRHSAGAVLELRPDGVLLVKLQGPLTGAALQHVKGEIGRAFAGQRITAFLVDYTSAVIALTGAELDAILEGEPAGSAPSLPAAMVVRHADVPLLCGHAFRMALNGIIRQVFTDHLQAEKWAARYAEAGV